MQRRRRSGAQGLERAILVLADLVVLGPLIAVAGPLGVVALVIAVVYWAAHGDYRRRIGLSVLDDLPRLFTGTALGVLTLLVVSVWANSLALMGADPRWLSPGELLWVTLVLGLGVFVARATAHRVVRTLRRRGVTTRRVAVLGSGQIALKLLDLISSHPQAGLELAGAVFDSDRRPMPGVRRLGGPQELATVLEEHQVDDVVIGFGSAADEDLVDVLRTCTRSRVEIFLVPRLFEMHRLGSGDDQLVDLPLRHIRRLRDDGLRWRLKRAFDVMAAGLSLVAVSPLLLAVAAAVRLELGGGVIFHQTRIGKDGREFGLLKFRSMSSPSEAPEAVDGWSRPDPQRVGPIGRFIRRYSLDELPQLWNVVRGDMSMVGPRPEQPQYVRQFSAEVRRYEARHRVPVGLTGLAAVRGLRGATSIQERALSDNWYIENWSLWFDLKILMRTAVTVVRGSGG